MKVFVVLALLKGIKLMCILRKLNKRIIVKNIISKLFQRIVAPKYYLFVRNKMD